MPQTLGMWGDSPPLAAPTVPTRRKKNVLCIDGGGVKGVVSLHVLAAIEAATGKPIRELFDLIVGCSAGGITALSQSCTPVPILLVCIDLKHDKTLTWAPCN